MSVPELNSNLLFEPMLDDFLADVTHTFGAPTSKPHLAHEILKLMLHSLRQGKPSTRMISLLIAHLETLTPEQALSLLQGKTTGRGFVEQETIDAFQQAELDGKNRHDSLVAAYDAYHVGTGRSYAVDSQRPTYSESTMKNTVKKLLHRAGVLKRVPAGRKKSAIKATP